MQLHGGDIESFKEKYGIYPLDFSAGISPLGMPENVEKAIIEGIKGISIYPDDEQRSLRKAIGEFEGIGDDMVICGCGAVSIIYSLVHALWPRSALIPVPGFGEYEKALKAYGCHIEYHLLKESENFALGDDILDKIDENIDMVFICQPNNPTGKLVERNLLKKILEKCERAHALLVVDECFIDFLEDSEELSAKELTSSKNIFIIKAFTKVFAMAGVRLGYGISVDKQLLCRMKSVTPAWTVSGVAELAGIQATKEKEYIQSLKELIKREKGLVLEEFRKLGIKVIGHDANYIFFKSAVDLRERLGEKGILIRGCESFRNLDKGYFRIGIRKREDNKIFIDALREVLEKKNG